MRILRFIILTSILLLSVQTSLQAQVQTQPEITYGRSQKYEIGGISVEGVKNYYISAKKKGNDVIFLRKIVRGAADDSYGIEVAKLAGVPDVVIERAKNCLSELIENRGIAAFPDRPAKSASDLSQISFSDMQADEIRDILKKTDLNVLTPLEAMNLLYTLQRKALS